MINGLISAEVRSDGHEKSCTKNYQRTAVIAAVCSAVVPGSGYIFSKRYMRAAIYFLAGLASVLMFVFVLSKLLLDLVTLGEVAMVGNTPKDNSQLCLIFGLIALIVVGFMVAFYVVNIRGAYRSYVNKCNPNYEKLTVKEEGKRFLSKQTPLLFLLPGIIAVAAVVLLPFAYSVSTAFTNYDVNHQPPISLFDWVGLDNFKDLLFLGSYSSTFFGILGWNLVFMVVTSILPYAIGIGIALLLHSKGIKGKKFFRLIFILPWAIPGYISTMMLKTMFTPDGPINQFMELLFGSGAKVNWLLEIGGARAAVIIVATWLGFSFPMMMSESILSAIPEDMYEAAKLDGAGKVKIFSKITLPLLSFSIAPIFVMGFSGAFNNMNVIVLLTGGAPLNMNYMGDAGYTDILISWLYKLTMTKKLFNYAAAVSVILFIIISIFSIFNLKRTRNFKEEDMLQ